MCHTAQLCLNFLEPRKTEVRLRRIHVLRAWVNRPNLELARIGSLLFIFADSPNDQIGSSSPIDTFATRLSARPLRCVGLAELASCLSVERDDPLPQAGKGGPWSFARHLVACCSSGRPSFWRYS